MKFIALFAVLAVLLVDLFGSKSSVGGPMADLLVCLFILLAVGIHEAWGRGPLGWIVSITLAVTGGMIGLWAAGVALETAMDLVEFQGKLATSNHPMRYIADVTAAIFTALGAWIPIQIANRIPAHRRTKENPSNRKPMA